MWQRVKSNIKNNLFSGLLVTVPIIITILVLRAVFRFFDNLILPVLNQYYDVNVPGLGIVVGLILIYFIGVVTKNYFGKKVVHLGESIVVKIPIAKTVYSGVKQILLTFGGQDKGSFKKVVLMEYPRKGIYSLGFLNGEVQDRIRQQTLLSVLVMTSINPTSGYLILVPPEEVIFTQLNVEEAMKWIVSGGIVTPERIDAETNPYLKKNS